MNYSQNQLIEKPIERKRHNNDPEKDVEEKCLLWMRQMNWSVSIFQAKATWSIEQNVWKAQGMRAGTPDCVGCTDTGTGVFIEFKALGRRSTFNLEKNYRQREFLIEKINHQAFACVVDSAELLDQTYKKWNYNKQHNWHDQAKDFLMQSLPQRR